MDQSKSNFLGFCINLNCRLSSPDQNQKRNIGKEFLNFTLILLVWRNQPILCVHDGGAYSLGGNLN